MFLFIISNIVGKLVFLILKILKKNGGTLPGDIALKIDRNYFKHVKVSGKVIAVTGTNGKTSTTNFIKLVLEKSGAKVLCNKEGNNINSGIASLILKNSKINGKLDCDYLVLETDEHYVPIIYKDLNLDSFIILNFFRDQLDRSGETENLIRKIGSFLKNYEGNLILNADDPNVSRLSLYNKNNKNIYYTRVSKYSNAKNLMDDKGEGKFCPSCSTRLAYDYYQYSHIGKFKCPKCDFGNVNISVLLKDVDLDKRTFTYNNEHYETTYNNIYSIYNFASAFKLFEIYNIDNNVVKNCLKTFKMNNGRLEEILINNCKSTLSLAKNPTGATVTIKLMNQDDEEKELLFVLNDKDADGLDVSWIYDINFSVLNNVSRVITSGTRAYDMAVRIKNSGYDYNKIESYIDIYEAVENLYKTNTKKFIISNYTSLIETRNSLYKYKDKEDKNDL